MPLASLWSHWIASRRDSASQSLRNALVYAVPPYGPCDEPQQTGAFKTKLAELGQALGGYGLWAMGQDASFLA
jgi:hypothetical protein